MNIKIPFVEKYRPNNLDDLLLEPIIHQKIKKILDTKHIPNMIITGEPSTGKTSTMLFVAKQIYKENFQSNVLELNASDDRGLTTIHNIIQPFYKKKTGIENKVIVLDEADSITQKAQLLLSNLMTKYINDTSIVFICNEYEQIIESIQSKCTIIKYPKISYENLIFKIKQICDIEKIKYDDKGIDTLLFFSDYDIRQSLNNLECIAHAFNEVNENIVYKFIDKPKLYYIYDILNMCYSNSLRNVILYIKDLYHNGYTSNDILHVFNKLMFNYEKYENHIYLNFKIKYKQRLEIYEIISSHIILINNNIDTFLQLSNCITKIYNYINSLK